MIVAYVTKTTLNTFMAEISGVPDIRFVGTGSNITENDGILTVCAVAGQLVQEFTPVNVVISTSSGVARGKECSISESAILFDAIYISLCAILSLCH